MTPPSFVMAVTPITDIKLNIDAYVNVDDEIYTEVKVKGGIVIPNSGLTGRGSAPSRAHPSQAPKRAGVEAHVGSLVWQTKPLTGAARCVSPCNIKPSRMQAT
jgi:hypothetical protein